MLEFLAVIFGVAAAVDHKNNQAKKGRSQSKCSCGRGTVYWKTYSDSGCPRTDSWCSCGKINDSSIDTT